MRPGEQFERYTVEGILGSGGMGCVYRAHDPKLGRDVAIKVLLPGGGQDATPSDESKARMVREARAAAALSHPNAVSIYDVGESDANGPYIVMELVSGRSLRDASRDSSAKTSDKIRWLKETASALAAAHDRGIVHRDVKPENVIVRTDGVAKVLDFGIARRFDSAIDPSAPTEAPLPTLTEQGAQLGTPLYMAPEQIKGDPVDGRSDQFSWGVLAYEVFTGKLPWRVDKGPLGAAASILTDKPPPMADVSTEVEAVVKRALSKDPADRYASMRELMSALDEAGSATQVATSGPFVVKDSVEPAPTTNPSPRRETDPSPPDPRRYDTAQFKQIFQRALERQEADGRYEHEDLVAAAREIGIRDDVLAATLADNELAEHRIELAKQTGAEERRRAVRRFWRLAFSLAVANFILFFMAHVWNRWLLFGTILGLAAQLRNIYFPREHDERRPRREDRPRRREERRDRKRGSRPTSAPESASLGPSKASRKSGPNDVDPRIEEGVRILLSRTSKRIRVATASPNQEQLSEEEAAEIEEDELRRVDELRRADQTRKR